MPEQDRNFEALAQPSSTTTTSPANDELRPFADRTGLTARPQTPKSPDSRVLQFACCRTLRASRPAIQSSRTTGGVMRFEGSLTSACNVVARCAVRFTPRSPSDGTRPALRSLLRSRPATRSPHANPTHAPAAQPARRPLPHTRCASHHDPARSRVSAGSATAATATRPTSPAITDAATIITSSETPSQQPVRRRSNRQGLR